VTRPFTPADGRSPRPVAEALDLPALLAGLATDRHDFAEVFRAPGDRLSLTVARWPTGSVDDQRPHTEDEVYYVAAGRAVLTIGAEIVPVAPGSVAFVAAGVDHRFSDITEDLEVLVFWSPARHRNGPHMQERGSWSYDR
jgi:mannose-6-phosphate isomerase-like protein (cupin superfamily)